MSYIILLNVFKVTLLVIISYYLLLSCRNNVYEWILKTLNYISKSSIVTVNRLLYEIHKLYLANYGNEK